MSTPSRPSVPRQKSHVPGGFDTDDDLSPIKTTFDDDGMAHFEESPKRSFAPASHDVPSQEESSMMEGGNDTFLQEKEMRRRLEDFDSTFLQEVSPVAPPRGPSTGEDLSAITEEPSQHSDPTTTVERQSPLEESRNPLPDKPDRQERPESPVTPPGMYQTPAPGRTEEVSTGGDETPDNSAQANTSSFETSSSPTAAAAARTVSRVVSNASTANETVDESRGGILLDQESTPTSNRDGSETPNAGSPTPTKSQNPERHTHQSYNESQGSPSQQRRRPSYFTHRMASGRSSYSSRTTTSTEASDITLGADYALQSGGAVPQSGSVNSRPTDFSRSVSLASFASGISGVSDGDDKMGVPEGRLSTVNETDLIQEPQTPLASTRNISTPTDTVIAQHVKDVQVPETLAREYVNRQRQSSPEKRASAPTPAAGRNANNLTLKEQSSTIDRLMKENWNLKLKITFLDEALNRKSDDSIKAMISENVDLRTAKFQSAKETRELKRSMRDLERKLKEKAEELSQKLSSSTQEAADSHHDDEAFAELEEEVTYLRERVTTYDVEVQKLRNETFVQETEKKKLAEVVKQMSTTSRGSDIGAREEVDLWKDLLDAETARREQADEDNRRLREEIRRLRSDASSTTTNNHATNVYNVSRRQKLSSNLSYNTGLERGIERNGASSAVSSTLVEQLRHENAELRREVGAQTSMLTSRNREKEWLTQEIEDLKLGQRRGDGARSMAGDSIFERSASRAHARPGSRSSDQTRMTQMSDAEREAFEFKNGQLRDQNAKLRLEIQSLAGQADQLLDELEQLDALKIEHEKLQQLYDNDIALATEDLQNLQRERDEALRVQEEMDAEMQDLKAEGSEKIGALEEELDQRNNELENIQNELSNRAEDAEALRKEVRTLSENMMRIEEEVESKNKRVRNLELELEELGHEADGMDKDLREEKDKNHKLSVQHESIQGEVAFLREEQDGDKMKIGDLEDALNNLRNSLASEKDRAKDLDERIKEERHQREMIDSKEKQEVQKMMNDLNRDSSASKEEARKLKKNLDSKTVESNSYKERLHELENQLREVLGDPDGSRPSFLVAITKMQKELEHTVLVLEQAQHSLAEKEGTLKNRDALLESHGLESKKLSDLLERERQGRRADKAQHEQWQRTHQHTSRTVTQKDTRITELESSRSADRKKISSLETQFKDQLSERNTLLLTLWTRVSSILGQDWQKQNSLINNHLPTADSITNNATYTPFSKTLLAAVNKLEDTLSTFQTRIKTVDRNLWSEYQSLEHTLDARIKKLDKLESTVQSHRISGTFTAAPEIAKLRGENRLLKSELTTMQKHEMHARMAVRSSSASFQQQLQSSTDNNNNTAAAPAPTLARHHSSSAVEHLTNAATKHSPTTSPTSRRGSTRPVQAPEQEIVSQPIEPSQQRWIHRLRELERRLKAEREARLLDRSGARKRLEEGAEENRRLKGELERERVRKGGSVGGEGVGEGEGEGV